MSEQQQRSVSIEQKGIFWWVYLDGKKVARMGNENLAKRAAKQLSENGYIEVLS